VLVLLDAHVSGPRLGRLLQAKGRGIRALDQEPALEGLDDEEVLALSSEDRRILVTHNVRDFPSILREWAAAQRSHAGAILVYGIEHREFELVISGIERWLELYPELARWIDLAAVLDRDFASG
jgi:predicted nuclease of predicted toxin-antitoxin system